jgi:GGDEF domain-containing protein
VVGAFEIYVPYGTDRRRRSRDDLRLLYLSLAAGLVGALPRRCSDWWRVRLEQAASRQAAVNEHQATHDHLTGLPNRQQLVDSSCSDMLDRRHGDEVRGAGTRRHRPVQGDQRRARPPER